MNNRRYMGVVAAAATLLSAAPLSAIFDQWTWLVQCAVAVALIAGAATLTRSLRAPLWVQLVAMAGTLLLTLTWMFPSGEELLGLIPTPGTLAGFGGLLVQAADEMRVNGVPVRDLRGLLFITVLGVGSVAIVVDMLAVSLRRPALAGLPMLAIYSVPVAVYTASVPPLPFVVGAAGFLWLLVADNVDRVRRFGRRFTGDGRDVDVWEPSPLAAAGRRLAVVGVLLAVALPFAVPSIGTGLIDTLGPGAGNGSGAGGRQGGGRVDLFAELSGKLRQDEVQDMVKVTTDEKEPYYLRFAVADQVTAAGFRSQQPSGGPLGKTLRDPRDAGSNDVQYERYSATVEITDKFNMPMLPVYSEPVSTDGIDSAWIYDQSRQMVYSNRARSVEKRYEFDYVRPRFTPAALRAANRAQPDSPYIRLPQRVPEVDEILQGLIAGKTTVYDKVLAIHQHFSTENGFRYSLETTQGNSGSAIFDFLSSKVGFCEQYAAAMAWLVRSANIPARVAFGFTNGNKRDGNAYTLTNRNLHAWTEVNFAGIGWVPFDATPTRQVVGTVDPAWAPDPDRPAEPTPSAGPTAAPGVDPGASAGAGPGPDRNRGEDVGGGSLATPGTSNWPWWTLAVAVPVVLLLMLPALRRRLVRRRRHARAPVTVMATAAPDDAVDDPAGPRVGRPQIEVTGDPAQARADAHAAWEELLDTLVDYRLPVDPAQTPRVAAEWLVRYASLGQEPATGARTLGLAEERARYARDPLRSTELGRGLRAVRGALAARASRRDRLVATFMPPSVLRRWRAGLIDLGTQAVLTLGRWRLSVLRLSPRRLFPTRPRAAR
ncbi:MAG TPA: DUF3488 and transglutaminase-like domain-containing protein [Pilimelia sp.]|nr:DUF3488 and transglutaminase-like domain-containing protein [Pilimelia sp.]